MECFLHVVLKIFIYFNLSVVILMACAFLGDFSFYLCSKSYRPKLFYPFLDNYRFRSSQNEGNAEGLELIETDVNAEIEIIETTVENSDPQVSNFLLFRLLFLFTLPSLLRPILEKCNTEFLCFCRPTIDNSALERIS